MNPHEGEPKAANPVSPETSAAIKDIKAKEPEKASALSASLKILAKSIAQSLIDEKLSAASAVVASVNIGASLLGVPTIKPPDFNDITKKIGSVLGGVQNQDTARLQQSIEMADQSSDPEALNDFEKQMSEQALARSEQRQAELTTSLKDVNGFRNEVDA